jgi:hypothetical protein
VIPALTFNSYCKLDEWENFLERLDLGKESENRKDTDYWAGETELELRRWASTRGQTLFRTGIKMIKFSMFYPKNAFIN